MNKRLGGGETRLPSLFDGCLYLFISLSPIFFLNLWDLNMIQGIFFTFGTFALLGISFFCKRQVDYRNKYLGLITLYALINVFIHTFNYSLAGSISSSFINYCLLSEGFIFILCGCLLFYLIVSYSKNFKLAYPLLIINLLNLFFIITQKMGVKLIWERMNGICGMMGFAPHLVIFSAISIPIIFAFYKPLVVIPLANMIIGHYGWNYSFSGVFALFLALGIFLLIKRKIMWLGILSFLMILLIYPNASQFWGKTMLRFELWSISFKEIILHPFIGNGFDNSVAMNTIRTKAGFMYRHNDYLNIARDLGLPFLAVILTGIYQIFKKTKINYLTISILALAFSSMTWTSMYFSRLAILGIVMLALKEKENGISNLRPLQ